MTKRRLIFVFSLNQSFHWFIIGLIIPVIALLQLEKGLNLFQIGIVAAIYGGTVILLELPTGGLADAIGRKRVYLISLVMLFLAGLIILIAWNFTTMIIGFFFWGVARTLSSGSLDAWFVDEFNRIEPEGNLQEALAKVGIFIPEI
jgi:DHA1 family quinolone resistance protein-like MFS transporter